MNSKILGASLALLWGATGSAWAQSLPQWLADARAREARLPPPAAVESDDRWLRAELPGVVKGKVVLDDGSYSLDIAVGDDTAIGCVVLRESFNLASFLAKAVDASFEDIEKANGKVEARVLEVSDAGVAGRRPYLALQWFYRANRDGDLRVGALKQFAAALDGAVVYCAHDELGFTKTFDAVTKALASSLRTRSEAPVAPHFHEVAVISMDGMRIGVGAMTATKDDEGDAQLKSMGAILLQIAPGKLVAQDSTEVQWVLPDGGLINAYQSKTRNGELTEEATLKRDIDDRWRVAGKIGGKSFDADVQGDPSSHAAMARARRRLLAQASPVGTHTEAMTWNSLDLTQLLPARATVLGLAPTGQFSVREEVGGMSMDTVLDPKTGTATSIRMPLGPRTMDMQRVYTEGEL